MARLIQDLLDVARMEAGCLSVEPARFPAGLVVSDAVDSQQSLAASARCDLRLDLSRELPDVWADRDRLLQVFENLIGNAIKFTPPGGTITVGAALADGAVRFWVRDTGIGIPAENISRLFDRFWQGRRADRRGVGLGLPISRGIVEAHSGRIWFESTPGSGATFLFTIPTATRRAERARAVDALSEAPSHRGVRLLAVDDEADPLAALAKLLSAEGFVVEIAHGGMEALSKLAHEVPDILLTDVQMPDLDGIALAQQIRKQHPNLPIILTTWLDETEQAIKSGLEQRHTHYVPKPIELSELLHTIDRALATAPASLGADGPKARPPGSGPRQS
jgi:CheY-like chemotaxis protein